jgi:hypothetical protein
MTHPLSQVASVLTPEQITLRNDWTAALRSGKYEQADGQLGSTYGGFCCLGVLCDIVDSTQWDKYEPNKWSYRGKTTDIPPMDILESVGIAPSEMHQYIDMNDSFERSFLEIADAIDHNTNKRNTLYEES